jgi:hypothetical protein
MVVVKINRGILKLPTETARRIGANAEFTIITSGDTVILKKITPMRLSQIAERAPKDKSMSLSEISQEVHRSRRSRRAHRR